jgi:hypothetical protein
MLALGSIKNNVEIPDIIVKKPVLVVEMLGTNHEGSINRNRNRNGSQTYMN